MKARTAHRAPLHPPSPELMARAAAARVAVAESVRPGSVVAVTLDGVGFSADFCAKPDVPGLFDEAHGDTPAAIPVLLSVAVEKGVAGTTRPDVKHARQLVLALTKHKSWRPGVVDRAAARVQRERQKVRELLAITKDARARIAAALLERGELEGYEVQAIMEEARS